jgi:hypothetical protein
MSSSSNLPRACALVLALLLAGAGAAAAQTADPAAAAAAAGGPTLPMPPAVLSRDAEGRVTVHATRLDEALVLDGRLDEEIFQRVPAMDGFVQVDPDVGEPATERTEAWVFFDANGLYVAVRCWESQPDRIVANELRRDGANIYQGDNIAVSLDTFYDRRTGFFFQTNALGALRDALIPAERIIDDSWNTIWDVRSRRFAEGWVTEMFIPFKSLRYAGGRAQVWGLNIRRDIRWKNESSFLNPVPRSYGRNGISVLSTAGTLVGVEPPPSSLNLELKPYALSAVTTNRDARPQVSNDVAGDIGFDVKYGLTRSLIADFTYNTDFAQVEADDEQVNLTRFNLRFPEKREFFLEGAGIFSFGRVPEFGPSDTPILFFSRAIGLSGGQAVPIVAGGRMTGKVGRYTVGALTIGTDDAPAAMAAPTTFSALRVKRDILRRSSVGIIATNRSRSLTGAGSNQVLGLDAALRFYENVAVEGYYARSETSGLAGGKDSYQAYVGYTADKYGFGAEHLTVGDAFNPEIGFLRREDFRRNMVEARYSPRPAALPGVRQLHFDGSFERFTDNSGRLETREGRAETRVNFENGDIATATYVSLYEFLARPFAIASGVVLPVGGYRFQDARASYRLGPQRKITGSFNVARGSFWSGNRSEAGYSGRVEVTPQLSFEPRISLTWVDLPQGDFTATLLGARGVYALTSRTFAAALVQYNSSTSSFTTNVRFRWEYTPGSDLFVVFSEGRNTLDGPARGLMNRGLAVKLTRLLRF